MSESIRERLGSDHSVSSKMKGAPTYCESIPVEARSIILKIRAALSYFHIKHGKMFLKEYKQGQPSKYDNGGFSTLDEKEAGIWREPEADELLLKLNACIRAPMFPRDMFKRSHRPICDHRYRKVPVRLPENYDDMNLIRSLLEAIHITDRNYLALRNEWGAVLYNIVDEDIPKNMEGYPIATNEDVLLASPTQHARVIVLLFEKWSDVIWAGGGK